jgi:hypothetical protein
MITKTFPSVSWQPANHPTPGKKGNLWHGDLAAALLNLGKVVICKRDADDIDSLCIGFFCIAKPPSMPGPPPYRRAGNPYALFIFVFPIKRLQKAISINT